MVIFEDKLMNNFYFLYFNKYAITDHCKCITKLKFNIT